MSESSHLPLAYMPSNVLNSCISVTFTDVSRLAYLFRISDFVTIFAMRTCTLVQGGFLYNISICSLMRRREELTKVRVAANQRFTKCADYCS